MVTIQIQLLRWPFVRIFRGEHPSTALWRERCQAYERITDIFAARLERQPARDAGGRYCKQTEKNNG